MTEFANDDVVIASAARTPIGRARKGSLASLRPDELAEQVFAAVLSQATGLHPATSKTCTSAAQSPMMSTATT